MNAAYGALYGSLCPASALTRSWCKPRVHAIVVSGAAKHDVDHRTKNDTYTTPLAPRLVAR